MRNLRSSNAADAPAQSSPSREGSGLLPTPSPHLPSDLTSLMEAQCASLNTDGKELFKALVNFFQPFFQDKIQTISSQQSHILKLESRLNELEQRVDDLDQYERRDTLIISGAQLPPESDHENPVTVLVDTLKSNLHIPFSPADVNVAHRLGPKKPNSIRPLIVKLHSRQKKSDIMRCCIEIKPKLYINESLTASRRKIFQSIWKIRSQHRDHFQQCYTNDGRIIVKLKHQHTKHMITTQLQLSTFLANNPVLTSVAPSSPSS